MYSHIGMNLRRWFGFYRLLCRGSTGSGGRRAMGKEEVGAPEYSVDIR